MTEAAEDKRTPFKFGAELYSEPELPLLAAPVSVAARPVQFGADYSGKPKIVFWVGRGKTGKTTCIRWQAEEAAARGAAVVMADMDPTNDTFSKYIAGAQRPSDPADPVLSLKWLDNLLQYVLHERISLLADLGGGDTTLRRLVSEMPGLVKMFEEAGFAVIVFYAVGPQEEDLTPLATLEGLGFHPTGTAIVLNEGLMEAGETRDTAFARIVRHGVWKAAVGRGAVNVFMPRLHAAQQVEIRRLPYRAAVQGETGQGQTPLGLFDRQRVTNWLRDMDEAFAGVRSWIP